LLYWLKCGKSCKRAQPDGFNIGINDGVAAGQTVMHLHIHLVPRYADDMPDRAAGALDLP